MSDKDNVQVDEEVVSRLAETAAVMSVMLAKLSETHDAHGERVKFFREELITVRNSLRRISKVLMEGNGAKPLIARVAVIEEKIDNLEEAAAARKQDARISSRGKYALGVAVVSGLAGVVTSLVTLLSS